MKLPFESNRITFERFMDRCLYDPNSGYYTRKEEIFGPEGDYYTSPYTHPVFARCLAEAIGDSLKRVQELPGSKFLNLVELGPGEGILAQDVLEWIRKNRPSLYNQTRYTGLEVNASLPAEIRGVIFSNEFFDALPVHRVRIREGVVREIFVQRGNGLTEVEGEISDPRILEYMQAGFHEWKEGYEYEINLRMVDILKDLDQRVSSGVLFTLDYGYDWEEYDSADRPQGTLMCYYQHQVTPNPYQRLGRQDITAHVNFEVMRSIGDKLGWKTGPLQTQREFLLKWGLEQRLLKEENHGLFNTERLEPRLRLKQLLAPGGISDTIKVLVQRIRC